MFFFQTHYPFHASSTSRSTSTNDYSGPPRTPRTPSAPPPDAPKEDGGRADHVQGRGGPD